MTEQTLFRLLEQFEAGKIARLQYTEADQSLLLERYAPAVAEAPAVPAAPAGANASEPVQEQAAPAPAGTPVPAPVVGTFYAAPSPESPAFVRPGDAVTKGQTLCIIEAMKMLNEVPAPCDGVIESCCATDGALVGFGDLLFTIREN